MLASQDRFMFNSDFGGFLALLRVQLPEMSDVSRCGFLLWILRNLLPR